MELFHGDRGYCAGNDTGQALSQPHDAHEVLRAKFRILAALYYQNSIDDDVAERLG